MASQDFTPKSLIIGSHPTVTGAVTLLTGTSYKKGAVLGKITASGKYKLVDSAAVDGSQTPKYVLSADVDATAADRPGIAYKTGQFNETLLTFGGVDTAATHRDALEARGIFMDVLLPA